jgi:hypothetical protein
MHCPLYTKLDFGKDFLKIRVFFKETGTRKFLFKIKDTDTSERIESKEIEQVGSLDWHHWFTVYYKVQRITVSILENGELIYEETIRLTDKYIRTMLNPVFNASMSYLGLGDHMFMIPTIEKLSKTYERRIDVITKYPELLINSPYVNNIYKVAVDSISHLGAVSQIYDPFANISCNFFCVDWRDATAHGCGFGLKPEEKRINFYPNPFVKIENLPNSYVLINPCIRGIDRELPNGGWQKIVDILNDNGIAVVAEGVNNPDGSPNYHPLNIKNGLNLCGDPRMNSLSQTWHLINQSRCYVTFDTGTYILAGTTDAQILLIDTYFDNDLHRSYRSTDINYKFKVIEGSCSEKCLSKLYYHVREHGNLRQPPVQKCQFNYPTFKCIPSPEKIAEETVKFLLTKA